MNFICSLLLQYFLVAFVFFFSYSFSIFLVAAYNLILFRSPLFLHTTFRSFSFLFSRKFIYIMIPFLILMFGKRNFCSHFNFFFCHFLLLFFFFVNNFPSFSVILFLFIPDAPSSQCVYVSNAWTKQQTKHKTNQKQKKKCNSVMAWEF